MCGDNGVGLTPSPLRCRVQGECVDVAVGARFAQGAPALDVHELRGVLRHRAEVARVVVILMVLVLRERWYSANRSAQPGHSCRSCRGEPRFDEFELDGDECSRGLAAVALLMPVQVDRQVVEHGPDQAAAFKLGIEEVHQLCGLIAVAAERCAVSADDAEVGEFLWVHDYTSGGSGDVRSR